MNENTQAQFPTEGQPAFKVEDTENDNSADSPTETTDTEQTSTPEGEETSGAEDTHDSETTEESKSTNFADHPRWKEREEGWKERFNEQERRHAEDMKQIMDKLEGKGSSPDETSSEIPSWFGGDEDQWKQYQADQKALIDQSRADWEKTQQEKTEAEQKAIQEATDYMNSEVQAIESDKALNPDGVKVDKNKLLKFTMDNELVDTKGRWNYKAAFRLMQAGVKSATAETVREKKDIAGASISEKSGAEAEKPNYTTTEDFQNPANRPW